MSQFLRIKAGQASVLEVLSQAEINAAHEGGVEFFMMDEKNVIYKLRTTVATGVDPRNEKLPVIDAWIPVEVVPKEIQDGLRKANEEDAKFQKKDPAALRQARTGEVPVASQEAILQRDMRDPNWRNSNQAKELADRLKVGNLTKDVRGLPHDGLPGPLSAEHSQQPGLANEPENAQVKENVARATGKVPTPETSEAAKPAAPSPGLRPTVPGPKGGDK